MILIRYFSGKSDIYCQLRQIHLCYLNTCTLMIFLVQNSFPMREWHVEHMEKTIIKFVTGLSANPTVWEKRQHRYYGGLTNVCKQIGYDIKHGATIEQVLLLLQKIRNDSSFSSLQEKDDSMQRLKELDNHFLPSKEERQLYY
jgi:hypothetical protein